MEDITGLRFIFNNLDFFEKDKNDSKVVKKDNLKTFISKRNLDVNEKYWVVMVCKNLKDKQVDEEGYESLGEVEILLAIITEEDLRLIENIYYVNDINFCGIPRLVKKGERYF